MTKLVATLFCLSVLPLHAATYYIDYATGDDSNNGTAKETPWKHAPSMAPFSGSYTKTLSDHFIFKGGVTWSNAALPLLITRAKAEGVEGNPAVYGADVTWFTGASFTRPRFDGEGLPFVNHTSHRENMVRIWGNVVAEAPRYVTLDNLHITGWAVDGGTANNDTDGYGINVYKAANIIITNCYIGGWVPISTQDDGGGIGKGGTGVGKVEVYNCIIEGPLTIDPQYVTATDGFTAGKGVNLIDKVQGCVITRVTQGAWIIPEFYDNVISNACHSFQSGVHENAIRFHGNSHTRGNIVRDIRQGVAIFIIPGWGGGSPRRAWTYNNVFGPNIPQMNVASGDTQTNPNENESWFVNNVIVGQRTSVGTRDGYTEGPVVRANNLFITSLTLEDVLQSDGSPTQEINTNNVVLSSAQAAAAGMTAENNYQPTSETAELVDLGLDFSTDVLGTASLSPLMFTNDVLAVERPQGTEWDVGAYEFVSESGGTGNVFFASSTYSVSEEGGTVTNIITRAGGNDGAVSVDWETGDDTAVAGTDYTAASGTVNWADTETGNKEVVITIISNEIVDGDRTFTNRLFNATTGLTIISPSSTVITITDDDGTPPDAPGSLSVERVGHEATLMWTDNSDDETGFYIERGQPDDYSVIATNDPGVVTYVDDDINSPQQIVPGVEVEYRWRVRAFNAGGTSAYSNTATNIVTGIVGGHKGMKRVGPGARGGGFKGL